ncbi:hypothetical protein BV25DRAFT_1229075 [Artomyces pyxidatus]|uniref:Uncharacterized protein n=1 Tax=Artomyces pyxidatus TaxID=48021 RepID=A0ACB8SRZ1_9AGAM|nr:hypothetical protein BV25DRAFT_1229075 [Artomyces pyxidatus]
MKGDDHWTVPPEQTSRMLLPLTWQPPVTPGTYRAQMGIKNFEDQDVADCADRAAVYSMMKRPEDIARWAIEVYYAALGKEQARLAALKFYQPPDFAPPVLYYGYPITPAQRLALQPWLALVSNLLTVRRIESRNGPTDALVLYSNVDGFFNDRDEKAAISVLQHQLGVDDLPAWYPAADP